MDLHPSGRHHIPSKRSLTVLPSSGKLDAWRREIEAEAGGSGDAAPVNTAAAADPTPPIPTSVGAEGPSPAIQKKLLEGKVIGALQKIFDPEIPVNIYELGLIYAIEIGDDRSVKVRMTLTAPACPVAGSLPGEVEKQIENIPEVTSADVELVWDPPWSRDRMSEAAMLQLGLF